MASATPVTIVDKGDSSVAVNSVINTATGALGFLSDGERWFIDFTVA